MPVGWQPNSVGHPEYLSEQASRDAIFDGVASWEEIGQVAISFEPVLDSAEFNVEPNHISWTSPWPHADDQLSLTSRWVTTEGRIVSFDVFLNADPTDWSTDGTTCRLPRPTRSATAWASSTPEIPKRRCSQRHPNASHGSRARSTWSPMVM